MRRVCCALIICWLCSIWPVGANLVFAHAGTASDYLTIAEMVRAVSAENLMDTVADLQENRDIDLPDKLYKSRYCLRVRDTDDPSDGACDNAADYIFNKFASYGFADVEYDPFIHEVEEQGHYRMRNVVATLPGRGPGSDKVYIVCSHYDSIAGLQAGWMWDWKNLPAPGADDNASGTAAVLEAARILSGYEFNSTIKFIAFSGEELGMFGSKHYAMSAAALGNRIVGVINLDMIAYDPDELDVDVVANEDSQWLANAIYNTGENYNIDLAINRIVDPEMVLSDHSPFWKSGYNAVLMIEDSDKHSDEFSPVNHTPDDTIDKLNFELALKTTRLAVATVAQLADPISGPDDTINPDLLVEADSVRFSHVPSRRGDSVTVTYLVRNLGPGDVEGVSVQVWLVPPAAGMGTEMLEESTLTLEAHTSRELSTSLTLDEWGDYQVLIKVNHDSRVFESDFSNNLARKTIFISTELGVAGLIAYPNPAILSEKGAVNFKYKLSRDASVAMRIYDIRGCLVYNENFAPGENGGRRGPNNNVRWNGANRNLSPVAAGIYICCIVAANDNGETQTAFRKLAVLR
jgi:hypothetical protein